MESIVLPVQLKKPKMREKMPEKYLLNTFIYILPEGILSKRLNRARENKKVRRKNKISKFVNAIIRKSILLIQKEISYFMTRFLFLQEF